MRSFWAVRLADGLGIGRTLRNTKNFVFNSFFWKNQVFFDEPAKNARKNFANGSYVVMDLF